MKLHKQKGLSLIELLVSLAIGGFLIIGAVTIQSQTRKTFTVNEQQARLQETARFAMSVIEPDAQLAGLVGFSNDLAGVKLWKGVGVDTISAKEMSTNAPAAASGVPAVFNDCGKNQVMDVNAPIQAEDGAWKLACAAGGTGYLPGTDTLTIRRSGVEKVAATAGRVQVLANRTKTDNTYLFFNGTPPPVPLKDHEVEVRDFFMKTYFVSPDSDGRPFLPSMRVKQIIATAGAGAWDDQELVRGVEDLQVELGIDTGQDANLDGLVDMENGVATHVNGDVARYVKPGDASIAAGQIVSVRIWIRVRAEEPEQGFIDRRVYNYGSVKNFQPNDAFRRVLMSRTIFIRNSRIFPTPTT